MVINTVILLAQKVCHIQRHRRKVLGIFDDRFRNLVEIFLLEMSMDEAREIAAELDKNAKIVGAAGAELRKLLPESAESPSGATRYEYSGADDL